MSSVYHIRECKASICLITGDGNLDRLVQVVSARFFSCKDSIFFIVIHTYSGRNTFFFFCFLGPHLGHVEVPRLGV